MDSRPHVRKLASLFAALAVVAGTIGPVGQVETASAATARAKVDPLLKAKAAKDASAVTPVIIERTDDRAAVDLVKAKGGKIDRVLKARKALSAEVPAGAVDAIAHEPGVVRITLDAPVATQAAPDWKDRPLAGVYPAVVGATDLWPSGIDGAGVGVAILDSGVKDHEDYKGADRNGNRGHSRLDEKVAVALDETGGAEDDYGHGTWVAGIVGGRGWTDLDDDKENANGNRHRKYVGVAPGVDLVSVKVSNRRGISRTSDVVAGIEWAVANKARYNIRVINLSLISTLAESSRTSLLDAAVEYAWFKGIVVVVAAGNAGPDTMRYPPANDPYAIVVGAADDGGTVATGDDQLAFFSSYGTTQDGIVKPDLVAPGRRIVSTLAKKDIRIAREFPDRLIRDRYIRLSGTSAAAPVVSGVVALLLQARPELKPDQVKWLLQRTATPLGGPGTGAGYPQADDAIRYQGAVGSANRGLTPNFRLVRAWLAQHGGTGFSEGGWDTTGFEEGGWDASKFAEGGWDASKYVEGGWDASRYSEGGWDSSKFVEGGWDATGFVEGGWDATSFAGAGRSVLGD